MKRARGGRPRPHRNWKQRALLITGTLVSLVSLLAATAVFYIGSIYSGIDRIKIVHATPGALPAEGRSSIAKLAVQFAVANPAIATTIAGSANPVNIRAWATWVAESLDQELLREVQAVFAPVKNIGHVEGLACNN